MTDLTDIIAANDVLVGPDAYELCAACNHSPAYHDGAGGRPCRAWDPDQKDHLCACGGWQAPPAAPAPAAEQPWGHERADLQGE